MTRTASKSVILGAAAIFMASAGATQAHPLAGKSISAVFSFTAHGCQLGGGCATYNSPVRNVKIYFSSDGKLAYWYDYAGGSQVGARMRIGKLEPTANGSRYRISVRGNTVVQEDITPGGLHSTATITVNGERCGFRFAQRMPGQRISLRYNVRSCQIYAGNHWQ